MKKILYIVILKIAVGCIVGQMQITPIFDSEDIRVDYDNEKKMCPVKKPTQSLLPKEHENLTKKCSK